MTQILLEGVVFEGTPTEIVEQIRKSWWWTPTTEKMFALASSLAGHAVGTPEEYLAAMVQMGVAKEVN